MKTQIAAVVSGEKYANYIPIVAWTLKQAKPEMGLKIWHKGKLPKNVYQSLKELNLLNCVEEKGFEKYPLYKNTPMLIRWLEFEKKDFKGYDYGFVIDIDFFVCPRFNPYNTSVDNRDHVSFHVKHMEEEGLCYSNKKRTTGPFLPGHDHFFKVEEHFNNIDAKRIEFKERLFKGDFSICRIEGYNGYVEEKNHLTDMANEVMHYKIITESGLGISKSQWFTTSHFGLHIGLSRINQPDYLKNLTCAENKKYFLDTFKTPEFQRIYELASLETKKELSLINNVFKK